MAFNNPLQLTTASVTTGGSNSSTQAIAANTSNAPPIKRLVKVTISNVGTNTASGRFYLGTASSGNPFCSFKATGSGHTGATVWEDLSGGHGRGIDISAGVLVRGALGTFIAQLWYTQGEG